MILKQEFCLLEIILILHIVKLIISVNSAEQKEIFNPKICWNNIFALAIYSYHLFI